MRAKLGRARLGREVMSDVIRKITPSSNEGLLADYRKIVYSTNF